MKRALSANSPLHVCGLTQFAPGLVVSKGKASLHPDGPNRQGRTLRSHDRKEQGGAVRVLVFADENLAKGIVHPLPPIWTTHAKYTQEKTTDLSIEVSPGTEAYHLKLVK